MNGLSEFEKQLVTFIGRPTCLRPFVCDGSPIECGAFIVGFNPATVSSIDFWKFWRADYGFDKKAWFDAYKKERCLRPLKPSRTRRNAISNTRRVLEWILESAAPAKCLETNIYSMPTRRVAELEPQKRDTAPFDFLLKAIQPQVILTHGKEAEKYLCAMHCTARIIAVPHFSRGWSQERACELGHRIRYECGYH